METAVLDASVLFRGGVRDFLLWVAEAGAFTPAWSHVIHEEWMKNRRLKFGDATSRLEWAGWTKPTKPACPRFRHCEEPRRGDEAIQGSAGLWIASSLRSSQ